MNKNTVAAALIAGTTFLWACGNNDKKEGDNMTTGETTISDSASTGTAGTAGGTTATLDTMDQNFAMTTASSDMLEIQSSNMAMQNASSERVKAFATTLIRDHGTTTDQLKSIVSGKNVTLPADMMPKHKTMLDKLQGKTGKDFDKAYMDLQVTNHREAVQLFERASTNLTNAELKGFATQHLPHLRMHLDSAQAINNSKM